jgi:haloacetate dehalogenase
MGSSGSAEEHGVAVTGTMAEMFEGFVLEQIALDDVELRVRHGGSGPAVLLLHGHPRTHTTWHRVAPILAERFTVVCPDLRGYGESSTTPDEPDHGQASKRAMARDAVELMRRLGHDRFAVVGHDRGAYAAMRAALDHPAAVTHLGVLDAVPIGEALRRADATFATEWWHWFFFAQPDKPERAILADPDLWYRNDPEKMGRDNFDDYRRAIHDRATVHAMLEDYRAGLGPDRAADEADMEARRTIACPTLVLWASRDDLAGLYGDPLEVWRPWAGDLRGHAVESGHHMAEEIPEVLARELAQFIAET